MPVIVLPDHARGFSPFMFSAALVGPLADAGLEGVEAAAAGAELLPEGSLGPLVLGGA